MRERDVPLPDLVAAQAVERPAAVAVRDHRGGLTYAELDNRVTALAGALHARGTRRGDVVGVCVDRSTDLVVALLAVMRSGAAYLPLDPGHPAERIGYVLADSGAGLVITDATTAAVLGRSTVDQLVLGAVEEAHPLPPTSSPRPVDRAYLIYTSGSTGRPKGVAIPHRAVSSTLAAMRHRPGLSAGDVLVAVTTVAFDISVVELFLPLVVGGTVVVASRADASDPVRLAALLATSAADVVQATPATWRMLLDHGWTPPVGFRVWCGGELMPVDVAERLSRTGAPVWDLYGPTETTVWSAASRLGSDATLTDWSSLDGEEVLVLDADLAPTAVDEPGEVYIAGTGLADGYAGRPGLTAERFVPRPAAGPGERMYRAGDVGRRRADGRVEILGRVDHQVKINGHRIEPGEIEARLTAHPAVAAAVVHPRTDRHGDRRLVAYLVGDRDAVDADGLREHLRVALPDYMVPPDYAWLAELPLNPNGKVDRGALPEPTLHTGPRTPPRGDAEVLTARLFGEVLDTTEVGADDDFLSLGGDSLRAVRLVSAIRRETGTAPTVADVFDARTVARIAALLDPRGTRPTDTPPPDDQPATATSGQRALWFLHQLDPAHDAYVEPLAVRLRGRLDDRALAAALSDVVERHEPLRTRFTAVDGEPVPVTDPLAPVPLPSVDLRGLAPDVVTSRLDALLAAEPRRPFDLATGPVFRATLIRLADDDHVLLLAAHHIACDGLSFDVVAREVGERFTGTAPVPPAKRFADFAARRRNWLATPEAEHQLDLWQRRLTGLQPLRLPTDRPRPSTRDTSGDAAVFVVPAELADRLTRIAGDRGVTPYMLHLAAFQVLLGRHSGRSDIAVGTPAACRPDEDLVGHFANTVLVRTDLGGRPTFGGVLDRVRTAVLDAVSGQDVPFDRVVERVAPDRNGADNPLFTVSFTYTEGTPVFELRGLRSELVAVPRRTAKFDLTLDLVRRPDGSLAGVLEYATALFDRSTVDRIADHHRTLLHAIAEAPDHPVDDLEILDGPERSRLTAFATGPSTEDTGALVHELVEASARRHPDAVALRCADGTTVDHRTLNARANRIAHHLRSLGVGPEWTVAVLLRRGPDLVASLLAVLKAGAAYLPLDPADPPARLAGLVAGAGVRLVVTQADLVDLVDVPAVVVDREPAIAEQSEVDLGRVVPPSAAAYVIFTSGSTGTPKGVVVEHRNAVNYLTWCLDAYASRGGTGAPLYSSMAFDLPVTSLFPALVAGEAVTLTADTGGRSVDELVAVVERGGFALLKLTPSHLALLDRALSEGAFAKAADRLVVGGEELRAHMLAAWARHAPNTLVVNEYGPTETTVGCSWFEAEVADLPPGPVPIGRPIANTVTRVLDAHLRLAPIGTFGELYVGGAQVARGYVGRPALTAERFVPDPYSGTPGARLYRTGDVARFRADGVLEFAGRSDDQVKIRGYRIEPGEVEAALAAHPAVAEAAVTAHDLELVAHVVPSEAGFDPALVRAALAETLPAHLVPTRWTTADALPRTPSGKIDRHALPPPSDESRAGSSGGQRPLSDVETGVAAIVGELLGVDAPSLDDNFFDLGGHSLQAIKAMSRLSREYRVDLSVREMFAALSVGDLADTIQAKVDAADA